jgi:hypothetical protein
VYVPSALYVPVVILLLGFSAYIIEKLSADKPSHNLQKTVKMNAGDEKNWHRSYTSGRLYSFYTSPGEGKRKSKDNKKYW